MVIPFRRRAARCLLAIGFMAAACTPSAASPSASSAPSGSPEASHTASADASPSSAATRVVEHVLGSTEVPGDPQRVVTLEAESLDPVLALGVTPIGTGTFADRIPIPEYLDAPTGIEDVGAGEPDLERVALLEPDLIIGMNWAIEEVQDELDQIAPTVALDGVATNWKENLQVAAQALGREAEAEALMDAYEERAAELRDALGGAAAETQVSVIRFREDQVLAYVRSSFSGIVIDDVGLGRPAAQDVSGDMTFVEMSAEQIPEMDGDVMFVFTLGETGQAMYETYTSNPLWDRLEVVANDRVHEVSLEYWNGPNVLAANSVLDDLFTHLVDAP